MRGSTWIALAVPLAGAGCSSPVVPPEFQQEVVEDAPYRIGANDLLQIRVWKNEELNTEAPVLPDGNVNVPLVGEVAARGLTSSELEDAISEKLTEYVATPEVAVTVREVRSKRASVVGEVLRSGPVNLAPRSRVMDALSLAGGFTAFANRRKIRVIRRTEQGEIEFVFNYDAYVKGKAPGTNVVLVPDDVIVVPD